MTGSFVTEGFSMEGIDRTFILIYTGLTRQLNIWIPNG